MLSCRAQSWKSPRSKLCNHRGPKKQHFKIVFCIFGLAEPARFGGENPRCTAQPHHPVSKHARIVYCPRFPPRDCSALSFITEPLAERRLLDVRLGELPTWLTTQDFSPRGLLGGVQKGEAEPPACGAESSPFPDLSASVLVQGAGL